jgi:hypothetical protein
LHLLPNDPPPLSRNVGQSLTSTYERSRMNKLMITGLAVGQDAGVCSSCNYDLAWLANYPSVLLWADRIIITETVWRVIQQEEFPHPPELAKACKLVFDVARAEGLVEIVQPTPLAEPQLQKSILKQVDSDLKRVMHLFPDKVEQRSMGRPGREGPTETLIDGVGFCSPYLCSVYASLVLAKLWGANCLFDPHALHFLRYKFGVETFPKQVDTGWIRSFTTLFESQFPNDHIIPGYAFDSQGRCLTCASEEKCKKTYLNEVETRVRDLMKCRQYDEIRRANSVFNKIIASRDKAGIIDPEQVAKEFRAEQSKLAKQIHRVFPKVKRWANVTTIVSVPLAVTGLSTGGSLLTLAAAAAAGLAQIGKEYITFLESKHRWVGFIQQPSRERQEKKEGE